MNVKQLSKYRQGVREAQSCIEQGKDAHELLLRSRNRWYNQGVKQVLKETTDKVGDSFIKDDYEFKKVSPTEYSVDENGDHKYTIYKSVTGKWACSCPGFKYRHSCKHIEQFDKILNQNSSRLPQHLARVRQLEKSLAIWQDRLNKNPNSKLFQHNVKARQEALEKAKEVAAKIEALPKPQRHPREEFLGVIPLLDKLFEGLAEYEIVGSWRRGKCFAAGTMIRTLYGWKPIEAIEVGDQVFNGQGCITTVTHTFKEPQKEWCKVSYRRNSSIICTPDHRFMVWKNNSPRKEFEWVEAKDLNKSCHWKLLIPKLSLPTDFSIGKEKAFLLGWYLADGNIHLDKPGTYKNPRFVYHGYECMYVNFAANSIRRKAILNMLAELELYDFSFSSNRGVDNTLSINVRDKELIEFLIEWGGLHCPELGMEKEPNKKIYRLLDEEKDAFLYGFWLGDGTFGKYNSSLSCRLYNTIQSVIDVLDSLWSRKFRTLRYVKLPDTEGYKTSYEVRITGNQAASFIKSMPKQIQDSKYQDGRCEEIKEVKKQFEAFSQNVSGVELFEKEDYRYCFEVAEGESFIAEGFTVHNSTYKDADILTVMSPNQWKKLAERLREDPNFGPAPGHTHPDFGNDVIRGGYKNGDRWDYLDINRVTDPQNYGAWLLFRTGDAKFNIACRGWLKKFGCGLNEHGIKLPDGSYYNLPTEQAFFDWIGIPFIEPEDREGPRKFYQEVKSIVKPKGLLEYEKE